MPDPRVFRTTDGQWRVYVYPDHTAELCDDQGVIVLGRVPLSRIAERLAEEGVAGDDLVEE